MEFQPYIPGFRPVDTGPLSRFLPSLEDGVISAWLARQDLQAGPHPARPGNWLLDPFGFSPRLVLEAARSGYRVLVTVNNPITRFLLETFANPPPESEFTAALADLGSIKKGEERLELHLQSLYSTACEKCGHAAQAQAFLWRKGEQLPYARIYECSACGDSGERLAAGEDLERMRRIAATDSLHRSRSFERVVSLKDEDRIYAEEAIQHYLPRPLYVLTTVINRLENLNVSSERRRALTALVLLACDAGNTLWAHPAERPRPKQLSTPAQFREHNVWTMMEHGTALFTATGGNVPCVAWPRKLPESGGICVFDGRLRELANTVKKEIPIAAVIGSLPRPNQAFWTFSALWAGWLWGREAVEPYKAALRRRRYDWAWNASALNSMFANLNELLADGVPVFGLLPEPEPSFLTSALSAAQASGFSLESIAVRTEHDPVQVVWKSSQKGEAAAAGVDAVRHAMRDFLMLRAEPASYLHVHAAGLAALEQARALKPPGLEFDEALRGVQALFGASLQGAGMFAHYSTGEAVETGMWGLNPADSAESLADRVELAVVAFLQGNPETIFIEVENDLNPRFPGLLTPSKGMVYAVLNSYAEKDGARWRLRAEDVAQVRRDEKNNILKMLEGIGKRLGYAVRSEQPRIVWEENGRPIRLFHVLASALLGRALKHAQENMVIVIPGGRAALAAYKQQRDPVLAAELKKHRIIKYRSVRALYEVPILTRDTFEEQIAGDPIEQTQGQLMMF
jgi:hypothetical protein